MAQPSFDHLSMHITSVALFSIFNDFHYYLWIHRHHSAFSLPTHWGKGNFKILFKGSAAAAAALLQSCPTLCDPIDSSPPGSRVPGILQARNLEWVAISFSNTWKWKVKVKSLSCVQLLATPWTAAYQAPLSMGFSRQEYWSGVPSPSLKGSASSMLYSVAWETFFFFFQGHIGEWRIGENISGTPEFPLRKKGQTEKYALYL